MENPTQKAPNRPFTKEMVRLLNKIAERGARQFCDCCGQRNSIENLFYCLSCGTSNCWQCVGRRGTELDPFDGGQHALCRCGHFMKLYDEWLPQARACFPGLI